MEYTFFSPGDADASQKTRKARYTAYGPTEGLENGPFFGRKSSKNVHFWIFLAKGPRWEDRATRRALEKVYFKKSCRITQATLKITLFAALALYNPRESWKKLSFFSRYYYFFILHIFKQNSNLRGGTWWKDAAMIKQHRHFTLWRQMLHRCYTTMAS